MPGVGQMARLRTCQAMSEAGIIDPESHEGINFCVDSCPHNFCIVTESERIPPKPGIKDRVRELAEQGMSPLDIAAKVCRSIRTIYRHLDIELPEPPKSLRGRSARDRARELHEQGLSPGEIALELGRTRQMVYTYLRGLQCSAVRNRNEARELYAQGMRKGEIATKMGLSRCTVYDYLK